MVLNRFLGLSLLLAVVAAPAMAQISSEGGPIYINSERTESFERENKVVLTGNVDIQQGDARLRADTVTLRFATSDSPSGAGGGISGAFGQIQTMQADGDVFYVTTDMKAKGDTGVYVAASDTITITGNVALMRGRDVAEGAKLVVEVSAGRTTLDGGDGRTRMVIEPESAEEATE